MQYQTAFDITPTDTVTTKGEPIGIFPLCFTRSKPDFPICEAIYVGGAGNVAIKTMDGATVIFYAVPVGTLLEVAARQVLSTNTTATHLVGLTNNRTSLNKRS